MKIKVPLCRHVKTNGAQCQSPAMEYSHYCFFHDRLHLRHRNYRFSDTTEQERPLFPDQHIKLHALEDADSIQLAISLVVNALATGSLRTERATAILYGLQLASANAKNLAPKPKAEEVIRRTSLTSDGLSLAVHSAYLALTPENEIAGTQQHEHDLIRLPSPKDETKALPDGQL